MSNDLISRAALLKEMEKGIVFAISKAKMHEYMHYRNLVNDMLTAYDEEKVVDQITKAKDAGGLVYYVDGRPVIYKGQAIEIIRAGGRQQSRGRE